MRYSIHIDNVNSKKYGLNLQQSYLFSFIYSLPSWADKITIKDKEYFFCSRYEISKQLPLISDKPDTVYRYLNQLNEKGIIEYQKTNGKDYIRLTEIGSSWFTLMK